MKHNIITLKKLIYKVKKRLYKVKQINIIKFKQNVI